MYHISDIKKYIKCPKLFYLDKGLRKDYFNYLRNDYSLTDIIKIVFNIDDAFIGGVGDPTNKVLDALNNYKYFINARFEYHDVRVKAFLLIKNDDGYNLYFFKPIIGNEIDLDYYYIVYDVLVKNGLNITDIFNISVNNNYELIGEIDFNKTLVISDTFSDSKIISLVKNHNYNYLDIIEEMNSHKLEDYNKYSFNKECLICQQFDMCQDVKIDDDSILHLVSSQFKFDMYNSNLKKLFEVDIDKIDCTSLQYAQIMASRNGGLFVDKKKLVDFMKSFELYPITFIDFEWDSYLFPIYDKMKCLDHIPFEFCLYTLDENGKLENKNYVGINDCREEFVKELINAVPKNGVIVAFNSFSAEVLRINELMNIFPQYKYDLKSIKDRFIDIAEVFSKGIVYDLKFAGKLSVKNIVSVISDIDYNKLNIKDGLEAVYYHRKYETDLDSDIRNDLVDYCNLDAFSLYVIYLYLLEIIKD